MEVPHLYPYNPRLGTILLFFGIGFLWIALDWFRWGHIPTGFSLWFSLIELTPIALALFVGVRRICVERYLLLDNDSMVLPIGLFQMRTAKIEYTSIRHVSRHYLPYHTVVLRVATEKQTFEIVSSLLPDDESYLALEEFLNRRALENTGGKKSPRD